MENALIGILEDHLNEDSKDAKINSVECCCHPSGESKEYNEKVSNFLKFSPDSGYGNDEDICLSANDHLFNDEKIELEHMPRKQARFKFDSINTTECNKVSF